MPPGHILIPSVNFQIMEKGRPRSISCAEVFSGRSVALFGLPGAFTPACHHIHMPEIAAEYESYRAGGVDLVAVTAMNDVFVMNEWRRALEIPDEIVLLADGNGDFARGLGLAFDGRPLGLGERSKRYAMWVKNASIQQFTVEADPTLADVSSAYALLRVFDNWSSGGIASSTYG